MKKLYCDKILNYIVNDKLCDSASKYNLPNYHIKSTEFLNEKLERGLPVPYFA